MLSKFLQVATEELGYMEKASAYKLDEKDGNVGRSNYTKYGKWYDEYHKTTGFISSFWCHEFVSWCAMVAGVPPSIIPYTASSTTGMDWFKKRGLWQYCGSAKPKAGYIIYFSYDGEIDDADHVGIVTGVAGSRVYTIEGNTLAGTTLIANGGEVVAKDYPLMYSKIIGYGTPAYKEEDELSEIINRIAQKAGMSTDQVESGLAELLKQGNLTEEPWETAGAKLLVKHGLITEPRPGNSIVEFGELGIILDRLHAKLIKAAAKSGWDTK